MAKITYVDYQTRINIYIKKVSPYAVSQHYKCDIDTAKRFEQTGLLQVDMNYVRQSKLNIRYMEYFYPELCI